uniref:Retrovirus-related Pol polyprotein from transposon TNT 1-94 n=1 Tax=Tanacetum cinerariifolium TaxID=118510 RepID=A0A6L2J787_TANCI|nr:retrovirus-related Pol polyprotein from transposon TNT 1-94 [Tanacetum cinerariifolium]
MPNPKDITDPTTAMNMALALMAKAFKLNYSTPTNNNQRISSNPRNRQIAQPGMNMGQDRHMQMVGVQNVRNQVAQNAIQNLRIQNVGNQYGQIVILGTNQNPNGNGNLVAACAEGNATGHNNLDEIKEVNANCILMANLQQASTSDFKSLAKEADESLAKHKALELEIERLLRAVIERLQAQLGELKGKSKDLSCVSNTLNPLSRKLENENVELEFQVLNYAKENAHLKTTYKNLFDSIYMIRTQSKTITDSLQNKLHDTIYENAKLRSQLFDIVSDQKNTTRGTSANTKFAKQSILGKPPKVGETHALSKPVTSNSIPTPQGSKVVKNNKVIAPGMFRINTFKSSREEKHVPNKVRASVRINPIIVSQPPVVTKKGVNSDSNGLSSTGVDNTKTRRPHPRSNTKNDKVPSVSKSSCSKNKEVDVEEHHRKLLLSRNKKHMSYECNNVKLATQNVKSKVVCAMCMQCLISVNHNVIQICLWCVDSGCSKHMTGNLKLLINFVWKFLGTVRFGNDHIAVILGFGDLQWGNILITRVHFVEGLGHNLFLVGQFCDSNLEVAFRRNTCFVRSLEDVDLLSGKRTTNLYTINLYEMASASPICLMARASSTKSWLWHQHLSHLNFVTINDLVKNNLVTGLPKFKYQKEHLCPSREHGKTKRASHLPKPVQNSRQRLHLLHMDLCGPMRIASINGNRYVLVIVDDYSCYTWAEAIATACFTRNCSFIHLRFNKTPYELINVGAKETMNVTFDELSTMAFKQSSSKLGLQSMTSGQISSRLDLTYASSTITTQQPTRGELDLLFEAMYDDYIGGQPSAALRTVLAAQAHQVRRTTTTSTSIADTALTPTNSSSQATNFPNTSQDVDRLKSKQQHAQQQGNQAPLQPETIADNVPNTMFDANTFVNPFANPSTSAAESSSSQYVDPSNMHTFYQPYPHEFQWTKDYPLEQVIGKLSRPVLTRNQLRSDGNMCMYALTVSTIEPKNVKEAMTEPAWIKSMQEKLH